MRKIVSTEKGKTYYYDISEDNVKCTKFETNKHMSGQEISDSLHISKSAVSQILKRSVKKIYFRLRRENTCCSASQIVGNMACAFNISTDSEYKKFFRLLPDIVKGEINAEAKKIGYCRD